MIDFVRHQYYKVDKLDFNTKLEIINDAFNKKYDWWVDELDCSKSWARRKIDMSFEDIMEKFDNKSHFTIVYRKGYTHDRGFPDPGGNVGRWKLEVSFRSREKFDKSDYFLWICCTEDNVEEFVKKYKLEKQ